MKELSLRGCNTYHHVSGVYNRGQPVTVNDSLAKTLLDLKTEKGMPYFMLKREADELDAYTPSEQHQDRINAGANVVKVEPEPTKSEDAPAVDEGTDETGGDETGGEDTGDDDETKPPAATDEGGVDL